jgi:tetratricopeptide (TPR) repeat protein
MYDIEELEKRWLQYRRKRLLRYSSVVLGLFLVGGAVALVLTQRDERVEEKVNRKMEGTVSRKPVKSDSTRKVEKSLETQVPSMNKVGGNQSEKSKKAMISERSGDIVYNREKSSKVKSADKEKKLDLEIVDPGNRKVVKEIEERFRLSKNYDDAIYLAEYYYNKRDYKKAIEWAKQANTIDSLPEESWMIFCKAKAKVGHRAEALKVLDVYYKRTGSTAAFNLMDLIRKNLKF